MTILQVLKLVVYTGLFVLGMILGVDWYMNMYDWWFAVEILEIYGEVP